MSLDPDPRTPQVDVADPQLTKLAQAHAGANGDQHEIAEQGIDLVQQCTRLATRQVVLDRALAWQDHLGDLRDQIDLNDLVFSKPAGYLAIHRSEAPALGGEPWSHRDVIGAVKRGATAKLGRSIGVHTLRHTFATHAVAAGVPLSVVSRQLGHADIHTTMRYAHHAPELTPGIFDRLADGGDYLDDPQFLDDSSKIHPREIEKAETVRFRAFTPISELRQQDLKPSQRSSTTNPSLVLTCVFPA